MRLVLPPPAAGEYVSEPLTNAGAAPTSWLRQRIASGPTSFTTAMPSCSAGVFGPSIRAIFGDGSPVERLPAYADLDEYALLHQAARWARGLDVDQVGRPIADAWRAILLRRPTWRAEAEVRAAYEPDAFPDATVAALGPAIADQVAIDLAIVDARPADPVSTDALLALEGRDGSRPSLAAALAAIPAYWLIGRRYRKRGA